MLDALATTIGALNSASVLDVDRSDDDRAFFAAEKKAAEDHFTALFDADNELRKFGHLSIQQCQSAIEIGDAVLDRGVRAGKKRMSLALKNTAPEATEHAFPSDISEIVDAERHVEPDLVLKVAGRFDQVPDFDGKDALKADLEGRAKRQQKNFENRKDAQLTDDTLAGKVESLVAAASDSLYGLEKRLLDRFKREKVYVRAFFLDVKPKRAAKKPPEPVPGGGGESGGSGNLPTP